MIISGPQVGYASVPIIHFILHIERHRGAEMRLFSVLSDWWANIYDVSKVMILVVCGWATPRFFDLYEYLVWSISDKNRTDLEALSYVVFFVLIVVTVKDSLDRARAEGRDEVRAENQNRPLQKSS